MNRRKVNSKKNIFVEIVKATDEKSRIRNRILDSVLRIRRSGFIPKCPGSITLGKSIQNRETISSLCFLKLFKAFEGTIEFSFLKNFTICPQEPRRDDPVVIQKMHELFNHIQQTPKKPNCRHLKILICKGTLRQVFIRVFRLEIQSAMLVYSTQLCELLPLQPSLWFNSPPFPVWISILYTIHVYSVGGGGWPVLGLRQRKTCRKVPLQVNYLYDDIVRCHLWVLSFNEKMAGSGY